MAENAGSASEKQSRDQWEIMSKFTKNKPHLIKQECNAMKTLICASPKQYVINKHSDLSNFPYMSTKPALPLQLKSKGIARGSQLKHLTFFDFYNTIVNNQPTRKVSIPALKRLDFKIYLIQTRKNLVSKLNNKRLFSSLYRQKRQHLFSFPLHYKRLRIIE